MGSCLTSAIRRDYAQHGSHFDITVLRPLIMTPRIRGILICMGKGGVDLMPVKCGGSRILHWVSRAFIAFVCLQASVSVALAQNATPTQQQLETFKNLPPDQQQAVLKALSGSSTNGTSAKQEPLSMPSTMTPVGNEKLSTPQIPTQPLPPRIDATATLILGVEVLEIEGAPITAAQRLILDDRRARILAANPYLLDAQGRLALPFLPPIALKGLLAEEAAQRLNADPRLAGLMFTVALLPLEPVGTEALKPFGYDLFTEVPTTFAPATDVPVPANYVVGPGDTFIIDFFGKTAGHYSLVVSREGRLQLPNVGAMQVAGLSFEEVSEQIQQRISHQNIGVQASVSMGELRSIRVFIVGDVTRPGSYTVSGLSTITNALFASGGVSTVGSLRKIELKRDGAVVGRFDLYDLLLSGDSSADRRLLPGDVIFVPPVGVTAGIAGQILRPAVYELRTGQTVDELLVLSGGIAADADPRAARLERIDAQRRRTIVNLDLTSTTGRSVALRAGDVLTVPKVLDERVGTVTLEGYVQRPGQSAWREGMRLTDLIGSLDALKLNADQRYVLIRRERLPDRRIEVLSADAALAFANPHTSADPVLQSLDRVIVFSLQKDRRAELGTLLDEIKLQVRDNQAVSTVFVNGRVRAPGEYPLQVGMRVSDLLRAGGGLDDAAYAGDAELTRFEVLNGEKRQTEVLNLNLSEILHANSAADRELKPYDVLVVQRTPQWNEQGSVTLQGEVKFPGVYPLRKGETLRSVIERAGGLSDEAYPEGTVFTRLDVQQQQQQQIDTLAARMQTDLSVLALQTAQTAAQTQTNSSTLALGQSLLSQLRSSKATGRLVVDLKSALGGGAGSDTDLLLEDGDTIRIPKLKQYVAVVGEVQNPTAHIWRKQQSREGYIAASGGTTRNADKKRIYVVRANGGVESADGKWWNRRNLEMRPGDTIVAPLDAERMRALPLWTSVTQIIYNLAVAVAAVNSF